MLWTEDGTGGMMMRMYAGWRVVCLATALVATQGAFGQAPSAESVIHVEISGLRSDKGQMLCALYSPAQAEAFPKKADKAVARLAANISDRQRICDFTGVAPVAYAPPGGDEESRSGKLQ